MVSTPGFCAEHIANMERNGIRSWRETAETMMTTAAGAAWGHLVAGPSSQLGKLSNSIFCSLTAPELS